MRSVRKSNDDICVAYLPEKSISKQMGLDAGRELQKVAYGCVNKNQANVAAAK